MKGGKGGRGRTNSSAKPVEKQPARPSVKKGAPKRDWGAVPGDDFGDPKHKASVNQPGKGKRA